jgi:hypothetical protein
MRTLSSFILTCMISSWLAIVGAVIAVTYNLNIFLTTLVCMLVSIWFCNHVWKS